MEKNYNEITLVLPIFEEPEIVARFIDGHKELLSKYPLIVVDKKGGENLKNYSTFYKKTSCPTIGWPLPNCRKFLIRRVRTEYTLNLDVDVLLPAEFISEALKKFENPQVAAVALDYVKAQGHLAFGPSIWRTKILQNLYDWQSWKNGCECLHMWKKLNEAGYIVEGLNMRAKHLKTFGDSLYERRVDFNHCSYKTIKRVITRIMSTIKECNR